MSKNTIIVGTTKGPVKGIRKTSILGTDFYRFRGIPYAKAPIGELRFKVLVWIIVKYLKNNLNICQGSPTS